MDCTVPKSCEAITFADSAAIAILAKDAASAMQMAGTPNGKGTGHFDPGSTASRTEVSAVLRRFVSLLVDTQPTQTLAESDAGSAMH